MKRQLRIPAVSAVITEHSVAMIYPLEAVVTLVCGADPHTFITCMAVIEPLTTISLMKKHFLLASVA
jgi:hypothetical protein